MICLVFPSQFIYADQSEVDQVSKITGNEPGRVAKLAEAMERKAQARSLARSKQFIEAIKSIEPISRQNGFSVDDERGARITAIDISVIKGDYEAAHGVLTELNSQKPLNDDYVNFVRAMYDFDKTRKANILLNFISDYKKRNKNIVPPKTFDLTYLSRTVRLFEMANEINQALELVEQYRTYYFPKKIEKRLCWD